jgi:ATP synthase protein I
MVDKETKQTLIQMAHVSTIGIAMVIAIFGCFYLGRWLDQQLETEPTFTLLFLLIGIAAGFRNMYLLVKRYIKEDKPKIT